jgi:TonB-linked SusC/RagA family outer membrane protein
MKKNYGNMPVGFLRVYTGKLTLVRFLILSMLFFSFTLVAQNRRTIKGQILDEKSEPMIGATIVVKGNHSIGTITDLDGKFTLNIPTNQPVIVVSFVSYETQEINTTGKSYVTAQLSNSSVYLNDVVVVGFGQQKKASVVGSITQTEGKALERAGGVSSVGAALTGNLPGVVTMQTTSKPGEEDPNIIIRGVSSWNNTQPLVLVDGIERSMGSVDVSSVETISVLKDASATAVYGVRGANGVILITTKRGVEGKAKIEVGFSSAMKSPSKLPAKYDAYDALEIKNRIVEYELSTVPSGWSYIRPQSFIDMFRNQTTQDQRERYPNIDWQKLMFKDFAMSYNGNINISGGSKAVKYYAAVDYAHEGDIVKLMPNDRGYNAGYAYDRLNSRANLDFNLSKSTTFKMNLSGSYSNKRAPRNVVLEGYMFAAAYNLPPDIFYPKYSDGSWGYCPTSQVTAPNTIAQQSMGGTNETITTRLSTDFILNQDLKMILKGLSAKVSLSLDNTFYEYGKGVYDGGTSQSKYIDPLTGNVTYSATNDGLTNFDFYPTNTWSGVAGGVNDGQTYRQFNYAAQLDWAGHFGDHSVSAMGNVSRQITNSGSGFPNYREDWVFRTTYDYKTRYFLEFNGAYNGSEKFGKSYRFGFFPSVGGGWMISDERFVKKLNLKFLDMLKLKGSIGQMGDDNVDGRWLYNDVWTNSTSQSKLTTTINEDSPYKFYTQTQIGNPNIQWEVVTKKNIGADFSFFNHLISGNVDVFQNDRKNIILKGAQRAVPNYFGFTAPMANLGRVKVHGYEIEVRLNKKFGNDLRLWANLNMTHAVDQVIERDDPALLDAYLKKAGFANNQTRSVISHGFYNTWDQLYGSSAFDSNDSKIPGNYRVVDFNCDGVVNSTTDQVPYGYPTNPQNTYNTTIGAEWKGLSLTLQFYGVNNVSRYMSISSFGLNYFNCAYKEGSYWSKDNINADSPMPRVNNGSLSDASWGTRYQYDGSYVRLKNAEIAYTLNAKQLKHTGLQALRIYLNGNDLWLWTRTPDDREVNGGTGYPLVRRYNLGVKITL